MTNKELREKIDRLETELAEVKGMSEAMKKRTDGGLFKPEEGQGYWLISDSGNIHRNRWDSYQFDYERHSIGNCFPTEQSAKDTVRALKLIQKAMESQDGFIPDWEDSRQDKYTLHYEGSGLWTASYTSLNITPILGYWGDKSACEKFIIDNHDELLWFFTEYRR